MKPMFFEADHTYIDEDGKEYVPSTRVCEITPRHTNFRALKNQDAVERAIAIGKQIHSGIENLINTGVIDDQPTTKRFAEDIMPKYKNWRAEVMVWSDEPTTSYAGHIDLIADELDDSGWVIIDVKTGSYNTVDYQEALYKRALCKNEQKDPNKGKLFVLPIDKKNLDKKLELKPVRTIPDEWIITLLASYWIYQETGINKYAEPSNLPEGINEDLVKKIEGLDVFIARVELQAKQANQRIKQLHEELYQAMDKFDVKSFDFGSIHATRVLAQTSDVFDEAKCKEENAQECEGYDKEVTSTVFDLAAFSKDHPELVKKYTTTKQTKKGYVTIKVDTEALIEDDEDGQV